ncbi:Z561 [Hepatospora eriocheir]|uniref:Z561 n=1 Tax=Hepatospora eriocheir TaxID=1081669 RepID=A0A1X0QJG5_9MICR|nr:Z561 [Hepatospora eriocheir]
MNSRSEGGYIESDVLSESQYFYDNSSCEELKSVIYEPEDQILWEHFKYQFYELKAGRLAESKFLFPAFKLIEDHEKVKDFKSRVRLRNKRNFRTSDQIKIDVDEESKFVKSYNDFNDNIFSNTFNGQEYVCPVEICKKPFPTMGRMKRHYITHTDIKPFKCRNRGCDRRFSRKDNMLQHYRMHCQFGNNN